MTSLVDNLFHSKHSRKILWKFEHFPQRYRRKCERVFFSEHKCSFCGGYER